MKKIILATIFTLLMTGTAMATDYEGTIPTMKLQDIGGVTRNSVFLGSTYSICATSDWFSYDDADSGIGKLWTAALLLAYSQGKTVLIEPNGVCDQYGVEGIAAVYVK
ncbi:hypothetical protein ACFL08_05995 [Patescibacteria group bacterium]